MGIVLHIITAVVWVWLVAYHLNFYCAAVGPCFRHDKYFLLCRLESVAFYVLIEAIVIAAYACLPGTVVAFLAVVVGCDCGLWVVVVVVGWLWVVVVGYGCCCCGLWLLWVVVVVVVWVVVVVVVDCGGCRFLVAGYLPSP